MLEKSDNSYPVSVVMERRNKQRGRWSYVDWQATGILTGSEFLTDSAHRRLIHSDDECQRFLWTNFVIQLNKDGAESYWNNLMADQPYLFVVARPDGDEGDVEPFLVSANYDEIIGFLEVDDPVYSLPIPPDVYQWLESYVVKNYIPQQPRKRKRAEWGNAKDGKAPDAARRH